MACKIKRNKFTEKLIMTKRRFDHTATNNVFICSGDVCLSVLIYELNLWARFFFVFKVFDSTQMKRHFDAYTHEKFQIPKKKITPKINMLSMYKNVVLFSFLSQAVLKQNCKLTWVSREAICPLHEVLTSSSAILASCSCRVNTARSRHTRSKSEHPVGFSSRFSAGYLLLFQYC